MRAVFLLFAWLTLGFGVEIFPQLSTGAHTSVIKKMVVSYDGKEIITSSSDKSVRVWDSSTMSEKRQILGEMSQNWGGVYSIAVSPDSNVLTTGGMFYDARDLKRAGAIRLYDYKSGKLLKLLKGHTDVINDLDFSPDGKTIVSVSADSSVNFWDAKSGALIKSHQYKAKNWLQKEMDGSGGYLSVRFMTNEYAIAVGKHQTVHIYDIRNGQIAEKYQAAAVDSIASGGGYVAIGCLDRWITIYDKQFGFVAEFESPLPINALALSRDGKQLLVSMASSPKDSVVKVYKIPEFTEQNKLPFDNLVRAAAFLPNGKALAGGGSSFAVKAFSPAGKMDAVSTKEVGAGVFAVGIKGEKIAFGNVFDSQNTTLNNSSLEKTFDLKNFSLSTVQKEKSTAFDRMTTSWNGYSLELGDSDRKLLIKRNGKIISSIVRSQNNGSTHTVFGFTSKGLIVSGGHFGHLHIFNTKGELLASFVGHSVDILSLAANDKWLVSGSGDQSFRVWPLDGLDKVEPKENTKWLQSELEIRKNSEEHKKWPINTVDEMKSAHLASGNFAAVYEHKQLLPLVSVFVSKGNDWIAWTPEGYFTASKEGAKYLGYHVNRGEDKEATFVTMDRMYDIFYRTDIVRMKLSGEDISRYTAINIEDALAKTPPEVKITKITPSSAGKVKVYYQINSTGGGIGEVRLFHNGKLAYSDGQYSDSEGVLKKEEAKLTAQNSSSIKAGNERALKKIKDTALNTKVIISSGKGEFFESYFETWAVSGQNEYALSAFNAANTAQSSFDTKEYVSSEKPKTPKLYIVSIGIDKFLESDANLRYAAKDANDFRVLFDKKAQTLFSKENIVTKVISNEEATKQNITAAFDEIAKSAQPQDVFVFFGASHGVLFDGQYYLVTHSYNGVLDPNTMISSNDIINASKQIAAFKQLFILDTCHAGGLDAVMSGLYDSKMSVLAKKSGLHIYASAGSQQTAIDGYKGNGLFTHVLLNAVGEPAKVDKSKEGRVSVEEIGAFAKDMTSNISASIGHPQTPTILHFGKDYDLIRVK